MPQRGGGRGKMTRWPRALGPARTFRGLEEKIIDVFKACYLDSATTKYLDSDI